MSGVGLVREMEGDFSWRQQKAIVADVVARTIQLVAVNKRVFKKKDTFRLTSCILT